jgi:uncharacterized membrane protein YfcA
MLGFPLEQIALLALWVAGAGIVVGILAGLFGIGGGAIIVPVLYEVFRVLGVPEDIRMQLCIGTSLAIIVPTTVRSYLGHKKKGSVIPEVVRLWSVPAVIGVAIGSVIATFASGTLFKIAFIVFAVFISTRMLFGGDRWQLGTGLPGRPMLAVYGLITGLVSSLVGVSGGAIANTVLTLYGKKMQVAVGTAAGVGAPITIAGTIGYVLAGWPHMAALPPLSIGFVSLIGFVLMAPISSFTTTYGVRLAHWMPHRKLEVAFGIFLLLVGLRFLVSIF